MTEETWDQERLRQSVEAAADGRLAALRQRAESVLKGRDQAEGSLGGLDVDRLINDVRVYQVELEIQNEELRSAQKAMESSRDRFSLLFHKAPVGYVIMDRSGMVVDVNETLLFMMKRQGSDFLNRPFSRHVSESDRPVFFSRFKAFFKNPGGKVLEVRLVTGEKGEFDARLEGRFFETGDTPKDTLADRMLLIVTDISDRKAAEKALRTALKEKEILLRELYHRTKNNMQAIISMINLQQKTVSGSETARIFQETIGRIRAMALVHEMLYQTRNLSKIDLKEYFSQLSASVIQGYGGTPQVALKTDLESVDVMIDTAIPCGLILNELLSNALRHGFCGDGKGEIRLWLRSLPGGEVAFTVTDDGAALAEGFDVRKDASLGLQSAAALAEHQLQGDFSLDMSSGKTFSVRFRETTGKERIGVSTPVPDL